MMQSKGGFEWKESRFQEKVVLVLDESGIQIEQVPWRS